MRARGKDRPYTRVKSGIDGEELKALLRRHNAAFTAKEVEDLGEMFYAAKGAGSVSYDRAGRRRGERFSGLAALVWTRGVTRRRS